MNRHVVCTVQDLPEGARIIVKLDSRVSVGVYNIEGRLVAYRNRCPHAGAPVCEGTLGGAIIAANDFGRQLLYEGRVLKCPWHAWEFLLPEGVTLTEPVFRLWSYPVVVEDGQVIVEVPARRPSPVQEPL